MLIKPNVLGDLSQPSTLNPTSILHRGKPLTKDQVQRLVKRNEWCAYIERRCEGDVSTFFAEFTKGIKPALSKDTEYTFQPTYLVFHEDGWEAWRKRSKAALKSRVLDLKYIEIRSAQTSYVNCSKQELLEIDPKDFTGTRAWGTPMARDGIEVFCKNPLKPHPSIKDRTELTFPRQVHHLHSYTGEINTRWVETLMGLPIGWVMPKVVK